MAIARQARQAGARVTLVLGPTTLEPPGNVDVTRVRSARQMRDAVHAAASEADAVVMAAAVADYTPAGGASGRKIKKHDDDLTIALERTPDILGELGSRRAGAARPVLIGFAAETNDMLAHAAAKLTGKQVDLI